MTAPVARLYDEGGIIDGQQQAWRSLQFWCPGCSEPHAINIPGADMGYRPSVCWDWDGNIDAPTVDPSILVYESNVNPRCHSWVRFGQWQFLEDSTHELAGQTVDMVPLPEWMLA